MAGAALDASALREAAVRNTGLEDWGEDRSFLVGLDKLIEAVEAMGCAARLREPVAAQVTGLLETRLRLEEDARLNPVILTGRIERPLIVTGLPRSGTTWLYELLALDPSVRAPLDWEVVAPWPAPELETWDTDPRIAQTQARYEAMLAAAPELATMHNFDARLPQECNQIQMLGFASSNFWAGYGVPRYLDWITHERLPGLFNSHRRVLQQLQWKGPRGRWTLKGPPHILAIEDLLAAYPDACIVQTHRDPAKMVASLANMIRAMRRLRFSDVPELVDGRQIARDVRDHFGAGLDRTAANRADPAIDRHFVDVAYRDTVADPVGTVRRIYAAFDLPFTEAYQQRLKSHIAAQRATGHGKHKYDMGEFGLDELGLPERFTAYRERFGDLLAEA
jgi:hypothetical protein